MKKSIDLRVAKVRLPEFCNSFGLDFFSSFGERFVLTLRAKPPFGLFGGGLAIFAII